MSCLGELNVDKYRQALENIAYHYSTIDQLKECSSYVNALETAYNNLKLEAKLILERKDDNPIPQ